MKSETERVIERNEDERTGKERTIMDTRRRKRTDRRDERDREKSSRVAQIRDRDMCSWMCAFARARTHTHTQRRTGESHFLHAHTCAHAHTHTHTHTQARVQRGTGGDMISLARPFFARVHTHTRCAFSHFGMAASLGICGDVAIPKPTNPIKGQCRTGGTSNWWLTPC